MTQSQTGELNIHQKLLKIADMAGVLQKNKAGYNYRYVSEDEIQAKVTAGMQKYGVMLYTSLVPGSLQVMPYQYEKVDKKTKAVSTVYEIVVHSEVEYKWVNVDNPTEEIVGRWAYIGQMEDASQAFGAAATYGNRYYLMKTLQLATTEADPDAYRSKQQEAEGYEEEKVKKEADRVLKAKVKEVVKVGTDVIAKGVAKEKVYEVVAKFNEGNGNPNSIKNMETATKVEEELFKLVPKKETKGDNKQ